MAIRKVEFTKLGEAAFLTSEIALQLMSRSLEEEARFNTERRARDQPRRMLTYMEAKQF